jgi:hypothetical protein
MKHGEGGGQKKSSSFPRGERAREEIPWLPLCHLTSLSIDSRNLRSVSEAEVGNPTINYFLAATGCLVAITCSTCFFAASSI